jgi:hypothetical protein
MSIIVDKYAAYFRKELQVLETGNYTGNIEVKVHFREGGISNMNLGINQSVKLDEHTNADGNSVRTGKGTQ